MVDENKQNSIEFVENLLEKARKNVYLNYEEGLAYLNQAYETALKIGYNKGIAWSLLRFGSYALSNGDRVKSIEYYKSSLEKMKENDDYKGLCRCYYSMATVYALMSHYDIALTHYLNAMELSEKYDSSYHYKLLNNIAHTYGELKQYDRAIEVAEKTIRYMKESQAPRLYMLYTTISEIYLAKEAYQKALKYSEMALVLLEDDDDLAYRAFANMTIAGAYKGLNFLDEALIVYNRALKLQEKVHNYQNSSSINLSIAEIYLTKKEYNYAFRHSQMAMTLALKHKSLLDEANVYALYAKLYEALENYKKAYDSYKKSVELENTIKSMAIEERYKAYHIEYKDAVRERSISLSQADQEVYTTLDYTLSELKSTYLDQSIAEKGQLTDAFVEAVVDTIDLRDTTTAGYSKRIAKYSLELMKLINEDKIVYPDVHFNESEMKEMYYAALMHDIGKLAIKEAILLKDCRLSEDRLEAIEYRFFYMKSCLEIKKENSKITLSESKILRHLDDDIELIKSVVNAYKIDAQTIERLSAIHGY